MARSQLISIIPFFILFLSIQPMAAHEPVQTNETLPAPEPTPQPPKVVEKPVEVVVEGLVNCQKCEYQGSWTLAGAKPIENAFVSVICKNHRNRVSYYKAFETDKNGYFYAPLKGFTMSHSFLDHPLHSCKVKLVSSPLPSCNYLTNVNYGLYGSPLRYEDKRIVSANYEAVIYTAGPLAFRPAHCASTTET